MSGSLHCGRTCRTAGDSIGSTFQADSGWRVRYVKDVDSNEVTLRFYQEVYDAKGDLIEVHHKYPVDLGHRKV